MNKNSSNIRIMSPNILVIEEQSLAAHTKAPSVTSYLATTYSQKYSGAESKQLIPRDTAL